MKFEPVEELSVEDWVKMQISQLSMQYIIRNNLLTKSQLSLAIQYGWDELRKGWKDYKKFMKENNLEEKEVSNGKTNE